MKTRPPESLLAHAVRAADPDMGIAIRRTSYLEPCSKSELLDLYDDILKCRQDVARRWGHASPPDTVVLPMRTYYAIQATGAQASTSAFIQGSIGEPSSLMQMEAFAAAELDSAVIMVRSSVTARRPDEVDTMDDVAVIDPLEG